MQVELSLVHYAINPPPLLFCLRNGERGWVRMGMGWHIPIGVRLFAFMKRKYCSNICLSFLVLFASTIIWIGMTCSLLQFAGKFICRCNFGEFWIFFEVLREVNGKYLKHISVSSKQEFSQLGKSCRFELYPEEEEEKTSMVQSN